MDAVRPQAEWIRPQVLGNDVTGASPGRQDVSHDVSAHPTADDCRSRSGQTQYPAESCRIGAVAKLAACDRDLLRAQLVEVDTATVEGEHANVKLPAA